MKVIDPYLKRIKEFEFKIPISGSCTIRVKRGDTVKRGDVLLEKEYKKILESFNINKLLGIKSQEAPEYITRVNGEYIVKGEVLAERLTTGGLVVKKIVATQDGVLSLERISEGYLDILSEHVTEEVKSNLYGKVEDVNLSESLSIISRAFEFKGATMSNYFEGEGEFMVIGDGKSVYTQRNITDEVEGKIVFGGRFLYLKTAQEILKRGAIAVIAWSMDWQDYQLLKKNVVVIGGFGQIPYDHSIANAIQSFNNSHVLIRKGSLYIADVGQYLIKDFDYTVVEDLKVNQIVKVKDVDNFFALAKVVDTNSIESGYVTVQYENGLRALAPREFLTIIY